jgi:hypothetical protein
VPNFTEQLRDRMDDFCRKEGSYPTALYVHPDLLSHLQREAPALISLCPSQNEGSAWLFGIPLQKLSALEFLQVILEGENRDYTTTLDDGFRNSHWMQRLLDA